MTIYSIGPKGTFSHPHILIERNKKEKQELINRKKSKVIYKL